MTTKPQTVSITPDEAEFQKWKAAKSTTGDDAEFAAWKAKAGKSAGAQRSFGPDTDPPPLAAHLLNAAQTVVPFGGEALEAAAGSLGSKFTKNPMSYAESLSALREETDKIPDIPMYVQGAGMVPGVKTLERIPGMVYSGARTGANKLMQMLSPAKAGVVLGAASGATQADPMKAMDRLKETGKGAVIGGVVGKTLDVAGTALRGKTSRTPGDLAVDVAEQNAAADKVMYDQVRAEIGSSRGGTSPAVKRALADPDIGPYVRRVQNSPAMQGATDADVLIKAKELLTDVQQRAARGMATADNDIATGSRLAKEEAGVLKGRVKNALARPGVEQLPEVTMEVPAVTRAVPPVETAPSVPQDIRQAASEFWERVGVGQRHVQGMLPTQQGTVSQQKATEALERHAMHEGPANPSLGNKPVRPSEVEMIPAQTKTVFPARTVEYPAVAPSLAAADQSKALREGAREAGEKASDVARRVLQGTPQAAKKLATKSPEAFLRRDVPKMSDAERESANDAIAARLKEATSLLSPIKSAKANLALRKYLDATKGDAQKALDMLVRGLTAGALNH